MIIGKSAVGVLVAAILLLSSSFLRGATASNLTMIAFSGDAAPDGNGVFDGFLYALLNDHGQVLFWADLIETQGVETDNTGLFRGDGTNRVQIARAGQSIGAGTTIGALAPFGSGTVMNNRGEAAIWAKLEGTNSIPGVPFEAVFRGDGTNLIEIARTGQSVSNGTIHRFAKFEGSAPQLTINDNGQIAFKGLLDDSEFVPEAGIFRGSGSNLIEVARKGHFAPDGTNVIFRLSSTEISLNNSDQVAFTADLDHAPGTNDFPYLSAVIVADGVTPAVELVRDTMTTTNEEATIGVFGFLTLNNQGFAGFEAALLYTNFESGWSVFVANTNQLVEIVRTGWSSPDTNGFIGDDQFIPALNELGQAAFFATLEGTAAGTLDDSGYFRGDGTNLVLIARDNQSVPGGNGRFNFDALNGRFAAINNAGQVAFSANLRGTSGGNNDNEGIYFYDDNLGLLEVARKGQQYAGSTFRRFEFWRYPLDPESTGFNNRGQIAFKFTLNNNRDGVALWTPPAGPTNTPPLRLKLVSTSGSFVLSWSGSRSNAVLQKSTNLSVFGGWESVLTGPVVLGGEFFVTNTIQSGEAFFRLVD